MELQPMVEYILEIDSLTTAEFCDKYGVPRPTFHKYSSEQCVNEFLRIDAAKHRMFVEHAKKFRNQNK